MGEYGCHHLILRQIGKAYVAIVTQGQNRTREIRPSGIVRGLQET